MAFGGLSFTRKVIKRDLDSEFEIHVPALLIRI